MDKNIYNNEQLNQIKLNELSTIFLGMATYTYRHAWLSSNDRLLWVRTGVQKDHEPLALFRFLASNTTHVDFCYKITQLISCSPFSSPQTDKGGGGKLGFNFEFGISYSQALLVARFLLIAF